MLTRGAKMSTNRAVIEKKGTSTVCILVALTAVTVVVQVVLVLEASMLELSAVTWKENESVAQTNTEATSYRDTTPASKELM